MTTPGTHAQRGSEPHPERIEPTAVGTQRRLRALAARSWSPQAIERDAGIPGLEITRALRHYDTITPDFARTIAETYDRLWNRDPPRATQPDREAADHTAAHARSNGWAPPMAWDDDLIDLPEGKPAPGWKPRDRTSRRTADLIEDAQFIRQNGGYRHATDRQVAARLGITRERLARAYSRSRSYANRDADAEAEAG